MKSFKSFINESYSQNYGGMVDPVGPDMFRIEDEEVRSRLNNYIEASCNQEFMNVEAGLRQIYNKVLKLGLEFDVQVEAPGDSGSLSLPLTQFGGRFGKDVDTPMDEFVDDDGISHKNEGKELNLNVSYERIPNGGFVLNSKIA